MVPFNQNKANAHTEPKNAVQIQIKCICTIKKNHLATNYVMKTLLYITNWPITVMCKTTMTLPFQTTYSPRYAKQVIILANNSLHSGLQRKTKYLKIQRSLTQLTPLEIKY